MFIDLLILITRWNILRDVAGRKGNLASDRMGIDFLSPQTLLFLLDVCRYVHSYVFNVAQAHLAVPLPLWF